MISKELERTLDMAHQEAKDRHHENVSPEHLLYVLLQQKDVNSAIINCGGDVDRLRNDLEQFFQTYTGALAEVWPEWRCPSHGNGLEDQDDVLVCPNAHFFSRRNGIPRFVTNSSYTGAFGTQWKKYSLTQLDSYTGSTITRDRAHRCIGEALWSQLEGKQILECGCGAGRFTEVLLAQGAYVTSIDLSEAVDANQENFPQGETHRIAQADILRLPFAPQQFDLVLCLGVIQHTPNPEETIARLYDQVKPGGALVIDHYTHNLSWYTKAAPLFRRYLRRLSPEKGIKATEQLVNIFWPLHRMARHFYPAQILLSRISPVLCYYSAYPDLGDELHREFALLDTHDSLTDWYKHFRTRGQIRRTLENLGLQEIWCHHGGNGVEARGKRPLLLH
jgi:2-polyprenyl-3-methyl-5-hydroxy-6-metoxy-1,4-benzoquinol methylase